MAGEVGAIGTMLSNYYTGFLVLFPPNIRPFVSLFFLILFFFIYAVIVWKMHKFIAKKDIIELNLRQYNTTDHAFWRKITASGLYLLEYIIILPFLVFFWFAVFTIFVMLLNYDLPMETVLFISALVVGTIRITAYYKEELSRDLAKLLPLNLLVISIVRSKFISFDGIFSQFSQLSSYFSVIPYYLAFIILIEVILRAFKILFSIFHKD
jgi:hypothetical protein